MFISAELKDLHSVSHFAYQRVYIVGVFCNLSVFVCVIVSCLVAISTTWLFSAGITYCTHTCVWKGKEEESDYASDYASD